MKTVRPRAHTQASYCWHCYRRPPDFTREFNLLTSRSNSEWASRAFQPLAGVPRMPKHDYVDILLRGVEEWNLWRSQQDEDLLDKEEPIFSRQHFGRPFGWLPSSVVFLHLVHSKIIYSTGMTLKKRTFAVRRTATGLGLFALEPIPARKRVIEYVGPLVANEEVEKRRGKYFMEVNTKWSIDGSPRTNLARYINHSCRPNSEAIISGRRVWIWSKRRIEAGEEITYDYGKEYFADYINPVGCKCTKCAGNENPSAGSSL